MATRYPPGLGQPGRALWREVLAVYTLRPDEERLLAQACAEVDLLATMTAALATADLVTEGSTGQQVAHPLIAEIRQHRLVLARLLDQLALPDDGGRSAQLRQARSALARKAVRARWSG